MTKTEFIKKIKDEDLDSRLIGVLKGEEEFRGEEAREVLLSTNPAGALLIMFSEFIVVSYYDNRNASFVYFQWELPKIVSTLSEVASAGFSMESSDGETLPE